MGKQYLSSEVKIALTAIAALVLLFLGFNFLKGENVFKTSNNYYIEFADIKGLDASSAVYANGYAIGKVRDIKYNYNSPGHVTASIELDKEMKVPEGTTAEIETEMLGGVKVNLVLPQNAKTYISPGDTIKGNMYNGAIQKVEKMLPAMEKLIPKIDSILCSLNRILSDPALTATLQNTQDVTANLKQSTAQLNVLLSNDIPNLTKSMLRVTKNTEQITDSLKELNLAATLDNVNSTVASVNSTVASVNQMTTSLNERFNSKDNSIGLLLNDTRLYDNLSSTMSSANELLIDLKAHPKRYVHFSIFGRKDK